MRGFFSDRKYDFLSPTSTEHPTNTEPTNEQLVKAITAYQKAISESDKVLDGVERSGGYAGVTPQVNVLDSPWKIDDREWFEQNQKRPHRLRMPFPGECDENAAKTPAEHTLIILVRQIEPRKRFRAAISISDKLLPVPADEATTHALLEVAMGREAMPPDRQALLHLVEKYKVQEESRQ